MKTFLKIFLWVTVFLSFNSCRKKAPDFNERLVGFWFGYEGCIDIIEIFPNGSGRYSVHGNSMECNSGVRSEGKVLCNKNSMLIGVEKFYFKSQPEYIDTFYTSGPYNDYKKYPCNEMMVLRKSLINGGREVKMYKIHR